jgi:DNA (cytosine-5)-methyltransferase 1
MSIPPKAPPTQVFDSYNQTMHDVSFPLRCGAGNGKDDSVPKVLVGRTFRRLTPVECERLMGFPDGWTAIPWQGKTAAQCPTGPRHKALGNSMAVNCMRFIGERIALVEATFAELEEAESDGQ